MLKDVIGHIINKSFVSIKNSENLIFLVNKALEEIIDAIDEDQKILRPGLKWFAEEMEKDLRSNDFKSGWLDGRLAYYWGKAVTHIFSLGPPDETKGIIDKSYLIQRCIKAANYLMFIAHNLIEEARKEEGKIEKKLKKEEDNHGK